MDLLILVVVPLILTLIYLWPRSRVLPRAVPVVLLAVLFTAFVGYVPLVQLAIATKTPLIMPSVLDSRLFSNHLDGISLLLVLLITGTGAVTALYAALSIEDRDAYRRFVRIVLTLVSFLLAFVLSDHTETVGLSWASCFFLITFFQIGRQVEAEADADTVSGWRRELAGVARLAPLILVRITFGMLQEGGAIAKQLTQSVVEISQLSTANLSKSIAYTPIFVLLLTMLLGHALYMVFRWIRVKRSQTIHMSLPVLLFIMTLYLFARLYPALHDNSLWWTVVTGAGLLMMLIGAAWALWQSDLNRLLIGMTLSGLGACLALLGLPDSLGVRTALMGIGVYSIALAGLFLTVGLPRVPKTSVGPTVLLAMLATAIIDFKTVEAFYRLTLPWAGFALAVVVLSTALLTVSMLKMLQPSGFVQWRRDVSNADRPLRGDWDKQRIQGGLAVGLVFIALVFALIFDPILTTLFPASVAQAWPPMDISGVALCLLAWGGGVILYLTRAAWGGFRPVAQSEALPLTIKTSES